jgi:hypothetical protein
MSFQFNKSYLIYSIILFIIEAWIAIIFKSGFIRHTFGDYLVVILLYCFIKSFINAKPIHIAIVVLIIAFGIEFLQLTNLLETLNLQNSTIAKLVLGSTFHVSDLIAYMLGVVTVLIIESKSCKVLKTS